MSKCRDSNAPSVEYFRVKDDGGGMPTLRERCISRRYDYEMKRTRLIYTVNLPSNKLRGHDFDHAIGQIIYA